MQKLFRFFSIIMGTFVLFMSCASMTYQKEPDIYLSFDNDSDIDSVIFSRGAAISENEIWSIKEIDKEIFHGGSGSLKLTVDNEAQKFYVAEKVLEKGHKYYILNCYVKGKGIYDNKAHKYNSSYVGFIVEYYNQNKKFFATSYNGTFNWERSHKMLELLNQDDVKSIYFAVFLTRLGTLWIDDVTITYR